MAGNKAAASKKRNANTKLQGKPSKALKTEPKQEDVSEGLFDNLDEEMNPDELENIVNQIEDNSEPEEEEEEEEEESNEDEEENDDEEIAEEEEEEEDKMEQDESESAPLTSEQQSTSKRFRDLYMTKVTQAFGSDLDQIRQEPDFSGPRLNILIDSLEAGIDIFSNLEQEIILADEEK